MYNLGGLHLHPCTPLLAHAEMALPPTAIHVAQRRHDGVFLAEDRTRRALIECLNWEMIHKYR